MASPGGANRIELESQILCAALRQSWADTDAPGVVKACQELYQIFPDLLPPPKNEQAALPSNYYELLQIECDVNPSMVNAAYLKKLKQFLRDHPNPNQSKDEYYAILNAGYILRKSRLRLSHDLVACKAWLDEHDIDPEKMEFYELEARGVVPETIDFNPPPPVMTEESGGEAATNPESSQQMEERLPLLIDLLKVSQIIGPAEVQALKNQMTLYPDIALVDLVLQAGYVTDIEMKSLQLAEWLLTTGKITMGQFAVTMFDERTTGRRMADSLFSPPGNEPIPPPGDEELPPPRARVPRKPKPSNGSNHLKLIPPKPSEPDPDVPGV